jgi:two-component system response regulator YesN
MILTFHDHNIVEQVSLALKKDCKYHQSHADLASHFNINESKLRKIFKAITGKTINEFLIEVRVEKAKQLLLDSDDPIKLIAQKVGYSRRNLEIQFKSIAGMTPFSYRIMHRTNLKNHEKGNPDFSHI